VRSLFTRLRKLERIKICVTLNSGTNNYYLRLNTIFQITKKKSWYLCENQAYKMMNLLMCPITCMKSVFFRSLRFAAYRQFTWWVHGRLGRRTRRIIPACATHVIRVAFPKQPDEEYTAYHSAPDSDWIEDILGKTRLDFVAETMKSQWQSIQ